MKTREDVSRFLNQFFSKLGVWGVIFLEREKNLDALKELGMTSLDREKVIRTLTVDDFVNTIVSPFPRIGEMWVFGKKVEGTELYIKISMGPPSSNVLCISFHKAEKELKYAFSAH